jgi:hypothetical protein
LAPATGFVARAHAVECLSELGGKQQLAHVSRARNEVGMVQPVISKGRLEGLYRCLMALEA